MTLSVPLRRLDVAGVFNLRDVGGYATDDGRVTRWGVLLRGDSLHKVAPDDVQMLTVYGLRTVIDLRRPTERLGETYALVETAGIRYHPISLITEMPGSDRPASLVDLYKGILDHSQAEIRRIVSILGEPGALPAVVHCTAGKDRTGMIVALLLGLAGVPVATIAADYALTGTYLEAGFYKSLREQVIAVGQDWDAMQPFLLCTEEMLFETWEYLQSQYGGARPYLEMAGVNPATLDAVRAALTASAAESTDPA
jgi:protein-tyrosine phosphatase